MPLVETATVKQVNIGGREYILHKLPATKAVLLATRLSKLVGDGVLKVALGSAAKVKMAEASPEQLEQVVKHLDLFGRLRDDDVLDLQRLIFPYVWLDRARVLTGTRDSEIDEKFEGYELDTLLVLWEAIQFNLAPFFDELSRRFNAAITLTGSS